MLDVLATTDTLWLAFVVMSVLMCFAFLAGRGVADGSRDGRIAAAQPNERGAYVAMWTAAPALLFFTLYFIAGEPLVRTLLEGDLPSGFATLTSVERDQYVDRARQAMALDNVPTAADPIFNSVVDRYLTLRGMAKAVLLCSIFVASISVFLFQLRRLSGGVRARAEVENGIRLLLLMCAAIAIATTIGIVISLFFESLRFFAATPATEFLFGTQWNAQTGSEFGALPLFFGTIMIAAIAICVAAPVGLFVAIYLAEYAGRRTRALVKPVLEVLAGIPTVVYGFFALMMVAPAVRGGAIWINEALMTLPFVNGPVLAAQPTNALAAGFVMGIMIIPYVSSLSDDVISAVPQRLRDGAFAVGATPSEAIKGIVLPAALPGISAALLLAISRAIGETMIVVMAAGQRAQFSLDPTSDLTTITAQIVSLLVGDSAFDTQKTLSAFALGLVLFLVTLFFNLIALRVVGRYRVRYE